MSDGMSPLRAWWAQDPDAYQKSRTQLAGSLDVARAVERLWTKPLAQPSSLFTILERWLELDVLEERHALPADRLELLRAETLAAYASLDADPRAADWAAWHLDRLGAAASPECRSRAQALRPKLGKTAPV